MYGKTSVLRIVSKRIDALVDAEKLFAKCFADSDNAFWLDSSAIIDGYSRFSFMGNDSGPLAQSLRYRLQAGELILREGCAEVTRRESIFDYMRSKLSSLQLASNLPFEFCGGFVGYLGYEMKAECGGSAYHRSELPDAMFIFVDRFVAIDHKAEQAWVVCLIEDVEQDAAATAWIETLVDAINDARDVLTPDPANRSELLAGAETIGKRFLSERREYIDQIKHCKSFIQDGESYEICLTNQIDVDGNVDCWQVYRKLRKINPAPYSAYLKLGQVRVMSSSPERFLRIDRERTIEAKPIKGTIARGGTPEQDAALRRQLQESEKDSAENLMIVDLLRNDIGMVAKQNSVHVPKLRDIESFATVHQMVSTIRGELNDDVSAVDAVRAAFPGGSMTGAPKLRTMEIIDQLEKRARGIYSGAIGYFSLNGAVDLNIVIRTLIYTEGKVSLGCGGAITWLSSPENEWDEIVLKARAPLAALAG
jgi:para-aminobenzoate synthetase